MGKKWTIGDRFYQFEGDGTKADRTYTEQEVEESGGPEVIATKLSKKHKTLMYGIRVEIVAKGDFLDYYEYIRSPEWKEKADAAKERAGQRCQVCNRSEGLNAHHRTYERLGNEEPGDITVLCKRCHKTFHDNGALARDNGNDKEPPRPPWEQKSERLTSYEPQEPPGTTETFILEKGRYLKEESELFRGEWTAILNDVGIEDRNLPALLNVSIPLAITSDGNAVIGFPYKVLSDKFNEREQSNKVLTRVISRAINRKVRARSTVANDYTVI